MTQTIFKLSTVENVLLDKQTSRAKLAQYGIRSQKQLYQSLEQTVLAHSYNIALNEIHPLGAHLKACLVGQQDNPKLVAELSHAYHCLKDYYITRLNEKLVKVFKEETWWCY